LSGYEYLDRNTAETRVKIEAAKRESGKTHEVTLLAAVKYATVDEINYLTEFAGVRDIGINRANQLTEIYDSLRKENLRVHFIGKLQTNKVKYIIDKVDVIQSVDSLRLAEEIDRQAKKHFRRIDILAEINSGREENKSGVLPEDAEDFCVALSAFSNLRLTGFMTMAPKCEKKEDYCKYFRQTYAQVLDIWVKKLHNINIPVISMGMSDSFEAAIECGSNLVRIGSSLFRKT